MTLFGVWCWTSLAIFFITLYDFPSHASYAPFAISYLAFAIIMIILADLLDLFKILKGYYFYEWFLDPIGTCIDIGISLLLIKSSDILLYFGLVRSAISL